MCLRIDFDDAMRLLGVSFALFLAAWGQYKQPANTILTYSLRIRFRLGFNHFLKKTFGYHLRLFIFYCCQIITLRTMQINQTKIVSLLNSFASDRVQLDFFF